MKYFFLPFALISKVWTINFKSFGEQRLMIGFLCIYLFVINPVAAQMGTRPEEDKYRAVQARLQTGWGTYNHKSVLSHVLLPEGFAMNVGIKLHDNNADSYLKEAYISSRAPRPEKITPGYKAYDGSYSELTVEWNGVKFKIESTTTEKQDLVLLLTPIQLPNNVPSAVLETGFLWNRKGSLQLKDDGVEVKAPTRRSWFAP